MPPHGYIIIFGGSPILIYNLDVLKNAILFVPSGKGLREEEVVYLINLNLLRQLVSFLFFLVLSVGLSKYLGGID